MATHTATDDTFDQEVLAADGPVLVDFWAPWCQPCLKMAPVLEEIAETFAGRLKVVKVDVEANPQVAGRFQIVSIPTLNVFEDGAIVTSLVGARPKPKLLAEVEKVLAAAD